ncbi:hypothetical protein MLD38_020543 [Melastoma candidum]|uniref:Uncharacterized protein n=1 Tax=Melastoma candidum TaxID=119954 RepID=A0ACB9QCT8_9MYRT|nr:hypothetical protein MLD38_020543 [Melastoma candidum]
MSMAEEILRPAQTRTPLPPSLLDDTVPLSELAATVDSILASLRQLTGTESPRDAQLLDLLPLCVLRIKAKDPELAASLLEKILDSEWPKGAFVRLIPMAVDLGFRDANRETKWSFLVKVFRGLRDVEPSDWPSVVYQLLVIASKGFCKREVIEGIVEFFGSDEGANERGRFSLAREIEGTVLLHVNFAVKQDLTLGKEVMAILKEERPFGGFNHFSVAVVLSVARVKRFNEACLAILKKAILTAYVDSKSAADCKWLPNGSGKEFSLRFSVVEKAVMRAVNESSHGREHLVPSILQLAFLLLESAEETSQRRCNGTVSGIEELGIQMLQTVFELHEMARSEIIEQSKFRILSMKVELGFLIVRLLGHLICYHIYSMVDYTSRLKELLDYFNYMHGDVATFAVASLLPLTKYCRDLLDYVILVVRKAMFTQEDSTRLAAAKTIFHLILAERKPSGHLAFQDSSSQPGSSQQAEASQGIGMSVFQDLLGLLQRCLHQQARIREVIYSGLLKLVISDPSSIGPVLDLLWPHFLDYFKEDADAQLDLSSCFRSDNSNSVIEEPLDVLLSSVSWILLQALGKSQQPPDASRACFGFSLSQDNEVRTYDLFSMAFLKIRKLIRDGKQLESSLGQNDDASLPSPEKDATRCRAKILSGILEVVLNHIACEMERANGTKKADLEKEFMDCVLSYYSMKRHMSNYKPSSGTRSNPLTYLSGFPENSQPSCNKMNQENVPYFSTSSISQLVETAILQYSLEQSDAAAASSQSHSQPSSCSNLKSHASVIPFVLDAFLRHVTTCAGIGKDDPFTTLIYGDMKILGGPLMKLIILLKPGQGRAGVGRKDSRAKTGKENLHQALICLKELIGIYLESPQLLLLLQDLVRVSRAEHDLKGVSNNTDDNEKIRVGEAFVMATLKPLLSDVLAVSFYSEAEVLCDIILMIASKLPCAMWNSLRSCASQMCKTSDIKNPKVSKKIVKLAIYLSSSSKDMVVLGDISTELAKVAALEMVDSPRMSQNFAVINKSTSSAISSCLLQFMERVIGELDWAVKKLKPLSLSVNQAYFNLKGDCGHSLIVEFEESVYSRYQDLVKVLSSFVSMSLRDSEADNLLRLLIRFYKQLALVCKLKIAPRGCKQLQPSIMFQNLMDSTCKQLTVPLYNFVTERQQEQDNSNRKGMMSKIKRENKYIPELIYQIEDYERYLIQLGKATKLNLLRNAKRSTARDFKILVPAEIESRDAPDNEPGISDHAAVDENESCVAASGESQEENGENTMCPESKSPTPVSDSDSDGDEDGNSRPRLKRSRTNIVVQDSDEEERN